MIRKIVSISEEQCIGCGLCVNACHEGAIGIVDGKARLLKESYCDGLGNCLPACPTAAIAFEEREAEPFDEDAVRAKREQAAQSQKPVHPQPAQPPTPKHPSFSEQGYAGYLRHWPVQIKLVPVNAPFFANSNLLVSADCAAYACGNFHNTFMWNRIPLIGCPKLDDVDYTDKLTDIFANNTISSVTVVRMDVPCCGGLEQAVRNALKKTCKMLPRQIVILSTKGHVVGGL
ncbi:MAG: 4Fe-4S binding protein [Desulfovibrio sp.]|jgi:ferredoxin|nr:4Fe-4S binding protein [Desulfovibrio sp.]